MRARGGLDWAHKGAGWAGAWRACLQPRQLVLGLGTTAARAQQLHKLQGTVLAWRLVGASTAHAALAPLMRR